MKSKNWQAIAEQLQMRKKSQLQNDFKENADGEILILSSSSDWGVCRNGGRRGSAYGPTAIVNILKKMIAHKNKTISGPHEVSDKELEENDFLNAQLKESQKISDCINKIKPKTLIHLGGGHDHIFPLLLSFQDRSKIHIINIDAHLDTRRDQFPHSGTPFRQFDALYNGELKLTQIGIHNFANAPDNDSGLKAQMKTITADFINEQYQSKGDLGDREIIENIDIEKDEFIIISLDCDAIDGPQMEAVSAVNHRGLSFSLVRHLIHLIKEIQKKDQGQTILGVYEYNPVYDNLSQKGGRSIASLLYDFIF